MKSTIFRFCKHSKRISWMTENISFLYLTRILLLETVWRRKSISFWVNFIVTLLILKWRKHGKWGQRKVRFSKTKLLINVFRKITRTNYFSFIDGKIKSSTNIFDVQADFVVFFTISFFIDSEKIYKIKVKLSKNYINFLILKQSLRAFFSRCNRN